MQKSTQHGSLLVIAELQGSVVCAALELLKSYYMLNVFGTKNYSISESITQNVPFHGYLNRHSLPILLKLMMELIIAYKDAKCSHFLVTNCLLSNFSLTYCIGKGKLAEKKTLSLI